MPVSTTPTIHWLERSPDLYEARVTLPNGRDVYGGYVAVSPGEVVWRGYVGLGFTPVGRGPQVVVQRVVEQHVAEIVRRAGVDRTSCGL